MNKLPLEFKLLKKIKSRLDKLMSDRETSVEIRSTELYEFVKKDSNLKEHFPTSKEFNQFLRKQHQDGVLKQFIPNYRVDTSVKNLYQWHFRKDINSKEEVGKSNEVFPSNFKLFKNDLIIETSDGQKVRSQQEKTIYERLRKCDFLDIKYDSPVTKFGETKYVDFLIKNRLTQKTYLWEHFGMTNSNLYLDQIAEKIEWYSHNGYKTLDNGGALIYTYYSDLKTFHRDIDYYAGQIENCG